MTYSEVRQILYENHVEVKTFHDESGHIICSESGINYYFDKDMELLFRTYP